MKSQQKKPVFLVSLYRRYGQLLQAVAAIRDAVANPKIVLVWAQPEPAIQWLIDGLGLTHVIYREKLPLEGECGGTTYPESHNIRIGLEYIKRTYGENTYVIFQAADVIIKNDGCAVIDREMQDGTPLCVFHWPNNMVSVGCYHTNLFAVGMDEAYWPPVCGPHEHDTLEWAWGKVLGNYVRPPGVPPRHYNFKKLNREYLWNQHLDLPSPLGKGTMVLSTCAYDRFSSCLQMNTTGHVRWYSKVWTKIWEFIINE